jgi:hypothetical protein
LPRLNSLHCGAGRPFEGLGVRRSQSPGAPHTTLTVFTLSSASMRVFPSVAATVKIRERLRIASGSQPASGSASVNLHENNGDIVDRAAI